MTFILIVLSGLFYRIRGGLLDDIVGKELPNFLIRSMWSLFVALVVAYNSNEWFFLPVIYAGAMLGCSMGYFGQFDLSRAENRTINNYLLLTVDGMKVMLPVAAFMATLGYVNPWLAVFAGAMFVPCYLAGNVINRYWKIQGHTQYGEWLLGFCIGSML